MKGIDFRLGSGLKVTGSKKDLKNNEPSYVKYSTFDSKASTKIIRMQEVSLDPLEPSKFRHKKVRNIFFIFDSSQHFCRFLRAPIQLSLRLYNIAQNEKRTVVQKNG